MPSSKVELDEEDMKHMLRQPRLTLVHTWQLAPDIIQEVYFHDATTLQVPVSAYRCDADVVICLDDDFCYPDYEGYWGPPSLGMLLRMLENCTCSDRVLIIQARRPELLPTSMALLAFYLLLKCGLTPAQASKTVHRALKIREPIVFGHISTFGLDDSSQSGISLEDVVGGFHKMLLQQPDMLTTQSSADYFALEHPKNGDANWIVPGQLLAMAGPRAPTFGLPKFRQLLQRLKVRTVVRLNRRHYPAGKVAALGIRHHDLLFKDGSNPSMRIQRCFLEIIREHFSRNEPKTRNDKGGHDEERGDRREAMIVHCRAGLGRTGTLIALWLMRDRGLTADEAIGFLRVMRPGMVLGEQPIFLRQHSFNTGLNGRGRKIKGALKRKLTKLPIKERPCMTVSR